MVKRLKLNDKTVRETENLGRDYQIVDTAVRGFSITIYSSGNRAFMVAYRAVGHYGLMPVEPRFGIVKASYKP